MTRNALFLLAILLINFVSFAQTGPGGVGRTDGTSSLVLWIRASDLPDAEGSLVTTLTDNSGYGNHFTSGAGATLTRLNSNGLASLEFNGTSHYFERPFSTTLSGSEFTIFTVTRVSSELNNNNKTVFANTNDPAGTETQGYSMVAAPNNDPALGNQWLFHTGTPASDWHTLQTNYTTQGLWATQMCMFRSTLVKQARIQGQSVQTTTSSGINPNTTQPIRIGAGQNHTAPGDFFKGQIGEIIVYNTALLATEITVITNYLAAKYGAALIIADTYTMDNPALGNFDYDVAALSYSVSGGGLITDAQGTGIVRFRNPSALTTSGTGKNFYWGHNGGVLEATEFSDVPVGVTSRFNRVWRVSEFDDVGTTQVLVDLSSFTAKQAEDVVLLIDTDNDGVFSDELATGTYIGANDEGSSLYSFSGVNIENGERFTFGTTDIINTPLPLDLLDFRGEVAETQVSLMWKTTNEESHDRFEIEHSPNGVDWQLLDISIDEKSSTSNLVKVYHAIDFLPSPGNNYYKLTSVDIDGRKHYHKMINVLVDAKISINVFPNPAKEYFKVSAQGDMISSVMLHDALGHVKWSSNADDSELITIPTNILENGVYLVRVLTTGGLFEVKKIVVELR